MTADRHEHAAIPVGLRERVIAATHQVRPAGLAIPEFPEDSPVEAFSHAADAFYQTLCSLGDEDWRVPVLRDLHVQGLVGHLIGVEYDVQRGLAGDPEQPGRLARAERRIAELERAAWRSGRPLCHPARGRRVPRVPTRSRARHSAGPTRPTRKTKRTSAT